jgi:exonuclease III
MNDLTPGPIPTVATTAELLEAIVPNRRRRVESSTGATQDSEANNALRHVRRRIDTVTEYGDTSVKGRIKLATYNIMSGRSGRLEAATRAMGYCNVDIAILTEAKLTDEAYTRYHGGYNVKATKANCHNQGGIALLWRETTYMQVEGIRTHGPNVISFELVSGPRRWLVIGAYVPPSEHDGVTCNHVLAAQRRRPRLPVVLVGDLNCDFDRFDNPSPRNIGIAAMTATLGVEDMSRHFRRRRRNALLQTWRARRENRLIVSRCDYIMSDVRKYFTSIRVVMPRHFDSDHSAVIATLDPTSTIRHRRYLRGRKAFPLREMPRLHCAADEMLNRLPMQRRAVPPAITNRPSWISTATWALIDQRAMGRRQSSLSPQELKVLSSRIRRSLRQDRVRRTEIAGIAIEESLREKRPQEAWKLLKRWYTQSTGKAPKPSLADFQEIEQEYTTLYRAVDSPGLPLQVHYHPVEVNDEIPTEDEISTAVKALRTGKSPGPSGFTVNDLREWEDSRGETWDNFVVLVKHCFATGEVPQRFCFSSLVLIPKSDGGVRGIGLLEVGWKVISMIIKRRLDRTIRFHESLHGFRRGHGTGTAILLARLNMDYNIFQGTPLFQIFLDLSKAYDTLDRARMLPILQGYGMGPRLLDVLYHFWGNLQLVPRQGGLYGAPIRSHRGVTQGDALSPIIFNIAVDAVMRSFYADPRLTTVKALFYADDGLIAHTDPHLVQLGINTLTDLFARVGLHMNATKTKAMVSRPRELFHAVSTPAYEHRMTGIGDSYGTRKRRKVACPSCGKEVQESHLETHMATQHNTFHRDNKRRKTFDHLNRQPITFYCNMPTKGVRYECPVPFCNGGATTRYNMRVHFAHRHVHDVLIIHEEGPLPRCAACDMFVSAASLINHTNTNMCRAGSERKRKRGLDVDILQSAEKRFVVGETELEAVDCFRYLGRPVNSFGDDLYSLMYNINKARGRWARVSRVLRRQGATSKISGYFYKAVVQSVLLYACETWTVTKKMLGLLEGFHHRIARQIASQPTRFNLVTEEWYVPPAAFALEAAALLPMPQYLLKRRQYLLNWVQHQPLYQLCQHLQVAVGGNLRSYWWTINP